MSRSDEPGQGGFAAARFPHNPKDLAALDVQGDIIDSLDGADGTVQQTGGYRKMFGKVADLNQIVHAVFLR